MEILLVSTSNSTAVGHSGNENVETRREVVEVMVEMVVMEFQEEDVFSWLDEVSLVDGVFDGEFDFLKAIGGRCLSGIHGEMQESDKKQGKKDSKCKYLKNVTAQHQILLRQEEYKKNDFDKVLKHINDFEHNISVLNEEVRMVQHQYKTPNDERDSLLEETISSFIKEAHWMQKKSENFVWRIKRNYDRTFKNQASAIKTIEKNLGRIAESIHGRGLVLFQALLKQIPKD
ncbi:hypothetical protein Tco_0961073 [Tanacetum coccineum]